MRGYKATPCSTIVDTRDRAITFEPAPSRMNVNPAILRHVVKAPDLCERTFEVQNRRGSLEGTLPFSASDESYRRRRVPGPLFPAHKLWQHVGGAA